MLDRAYFVLLAEYNRWANRRLYTAVAQLSDAEYRKPRPSFFGSIGKTLNHILVGDRIWMSRFTQTSVAITSLDQILHDDFADLRQARETEDDRILATMQNFDAAKLPTVLVYQSMGGVQGRIQYDLGLAHMFNHQTHHRGQVHDQLSATTVAPPELDFLLYLRAHRPA